MVCYYVPLFLDIRFLCVLFIQKGMKVIGQSVDVKQIIDVPAKSLKIEGSKGEVELIPPSGTLGYKPIPLLLLSHKWREGQTPVSG